MNLPVRRLAAGHEEHRMQGPVPYMQRTRDWYLALGYDNPYVWAHHDDAPFQLLPRPL